MGVLMMWFVPAEMKWMNFRLGTASAEGGTAARVTRMVASR
jgi:hypothetical protein